MTASRILKWVSGSLEIFLAIPILGAAVVIGSFYLVLPVMLGLHIATLVLSVKNNEPKYGSIMGIITSVLAWIPFVGWILHLLTGIFLMVTAAQENRNIPPSFQT